MSYVVWDANVDPPARIAAAGTPETARSLRALYLHCTPDVDPSWVYVATGEVTS